MYNIPLSFRISHFSSLISVQCLFCIVFPCPPVKNITFILLANIKLAAPDSNVTTQGTEMQISQKALMARFSNFCGGL